VEDLNCGLEIMLRIFQHIAALIRLEEKLQRFLVLSLYSTETVG